VVPVTVRRLARAVFAVSRAALVLALAAAACARGPAALRPAETSGFLDDYSRLRPGPAEGATWVYRNPDARVAAYDRILFEPVAVWRSGKRSLDAIPEEDLQRLAAEFQRAVRSRLAADYRLVDAAGPGILRVRLAITAARREDRALDVFTFAVPPEHPVPDTEQLDAAMHALVVAAAIEGELSDSVTGEVIATGVDLRGERRALRTWGDVRAALDRWAAWLAGRLREARSERSD
jgi:hypothetical protein